MPAHNVQYMIDHATSLFSRYGRHMLEDEALVDLLNSYRQAIGRTQEMMRGTGVVGCCASCAAREPGGCCAREVEEWYDEWLLFINLLMGCSIETPRFHPESCIFVGPEGCRLIARYSFCVNFLCQSIVSSLGKELAHRLSAVSGEELFAGWRVEQAVRQWIKNNAQTPHQPPTPPP